MSEADKAPTVLNAGSEAKPKSFARVEMVTCDVCLRANPPTRINCLYCLATLPVTRNPTVQSTEFSRALSAEDPTKVGTQNAFYLVLTKTQTRVLDDFSLAAVAEVLQLQTSDVESTISLDSPVPLLRAATFEQANVLADKLRELGVGVEIVAEETLNFDAPIRKARELEFTDDGLIATLLRGGKISLRWDDLILIVIGRWRVVRKESEERRGRRASRPVDNRELSSDEPVLDLYARSDNVGCRISSGSFDFSCLGDRKAVTAFENFTTLVRLLKQRAPNIEIDETYRSLRAVLANVWPLEPQTRTGQWQRRGVGKVDVSTVTTIDNEIQFNCYSRLRQRMRLREMEGDR